MNNEDLVLVVLDDSADGDTFFIFSVLFGSDCFQWYLAQGLLGSMIRS